MALFLDHLLNLLHDLQVVAHPVVDFGVFLRLDPQFRRSDLVEHHRVHCLSGQFILGTLLDALLLFAFAVDDSPYVLTGLECELCFNMVALGEYVVDLPPPLDVGGVLVEGHDASCLISEGA